nr:hypothetical protein [Tanacetum cinerariifolium]
LSNQAFDVLPSDEEIVSFIKKLSHKGDVKSITELVVDHMYQPWRTFATIINKCLSGKITVEEEETEPAKKDKPTKKPATKNNILGFKSETLLGDSGDEADEQGDDERTESNDEPAETDNPKTSDDEEETEDEFVHTPPNYVPNDDEEYDESND